MFFVVAIFLDEILVKGRVDAGVLGNVHVYMHEIACCERFAVEMGFLAICGLKRRLLPSAGLQKTRGIGKEWGADISWAG
jgi:hypothetical protein